VQGPAVLAPRYVLPFLVFAVVSCLREAFPGLRADKEVASAVRGMRELSRTIGVGVPVQQNESKKVALAILKATPKVYGSTITKGAAFRFKNALNENAKKHSMADYAPELFHNEVEAWDGGMGGGERFLPVFLRHTKDPESERRRFDLVEKMLARAGTKSLQLQGEGSTDLAELMTLVYKLDFASYYTAIARGFDPLPTNLLSAVKKLT
jgi:glucose/mannose-6-phosphate isomerase